jgi:hypothetical protein
MSVKIYDNIVLFGKDVHVWNREKQKSEKSDLLDFYVSDENNKNTLATGKNWASKYNYKDQDKVVEIHTENKGFKFSLDSSAEGSSCGGKLSFWMCRIDKDDIHGRIGINQEELNQLFKESTFINGVCQQEVCFYRLNGKVGVCVVGGERYKEFHQKNDKDNELSKAKKTSKWELGRVYESKTIKQVWVGDVTNCITGEKCHLILKARDNIEDTINDSRWFYEDENLRDKFTSKVATDKILDASRSSELLAKRQKEEIIKEIDKMINYIDKIDKNDRWDNVYRGYFAYYFAYYIDDFQKELLMDYLYISKYYYEIYNAKDKYYIYDRTYIALEEYLKALNCAENVNIDEILNKYRRK